MAARVFARRHNLAPAAAGAFVMSAVFLPHHTLYADEPSEPISRKPIYDDLALIRNPPRRKPPSTTATQTPTDRLATYVQRGRLSLHGYIASGEDSLNNLMSTLFKYEHSFTSTVASLAPPKESHERLMPGAIYVLVATLAGSIISRNRNILVRSTFPAAVGIGAAWMVLPLTMRNVSDLMWVYEGKAPFIAENHLRARGAVLAAVEEARKQSKGMRKWLDESVVKGKEGLEGWVRKSP